MCALSKSRCHSVVSLNPKSSSKGVQEWDHLERGLEVVSTSCDRGVDSLGGSKESKKVVAGEWDLFSLPTTIVSFAPQRANGPVLTCLELNRREDVRVGDDFKWQSDSR
jgi:hypothetical protein